MASQSAAVRKVRGVLRNNRISVQQLFSVQQLCGDHAFGGFVQVVALVQAGIFGTVCVTGQWGAASQHLVHSLEQRALEYGS